MTLSGFRRRQSQGLSRLRKTAYSPAVSQLITIALTYAFSISATSQIEVGPPSLLNSNGRTDAGDDANPQVTTDGKGVWMAVWHSTEDLDGVAGDDSDILLATSLDNGQTWTSPRVLNTNATSDTGSDELPQVTTDGKGNWVVVWNSLEDIGGTTGADNDIFVAMSTNNGVTWSAPSLLNTNGNSDSEVDYDPHITTDGTGDWVVVWTSKEDLGGMASSSLALSRHSFGNRRNITDGLGCPTSRLPPMNP